jgi:hypothetical protein
MRTACISYGIRDDLPMALIEISFKTNKACRGGACSAHQISHGSFLARQISFKSLPIG